MSALVIGGQKAGDHTWNDFDVIDELQQDDKKTLLMRLKKNGDVFIVERLIYIDEEKKIIAEEYVQMLIQSQSEYSQHLFEFFIDENDLCIIMEYYPNGNLRDLITIEMKNMPLKEKKTIAYKYGYQMLMCLSVLYKKKIVHHQLKPENILIDKDQNVKLANFGPSFKSEGKLNIPSTETQIYQSPESHTSKINIWTLGVIMLELITGVHPFSGKKNEDTIQNIIAGKMSPLPSYIRGDLKEMIFWMLNQDPNKRPSAEQVLEIDIMQVIAKIEKDNEQKIKDLEMEKQKIILEKEWIVSEKEICQKKAVASELQISNLTEEISKLNYQVSILNKEQIKNELINTTQEMEPNQTLTSTSML
ncbi:MAG: putative protein kinase,serine/threonine-protein kinase, partial [Streblomastix strix]